MRKFLIFSFAVSLLVLFGAGCAKKNAPTLESIFLNNRVAFTEIAKTIANEKNIFSVSLRTNEGKPCQEINGWEQCGANAPWQKFEGGELRAVLAVEDVAVQEDIPIETCAAIITFMNEYSLRGITRSGQYDGVVEFANDSFWKLVYAVGNNAEQIRQSSAVMTTKEIDEHWYVYDYSS